jgi:hypothetical protein
MTFITVDTDENGDLPATLPTQEDGTPFPFVMEVSDTVVFSDSRTDLVGLIIDGYDQIPKTADGDREALLARAAFASRYADGLQQLLVSRAIEDGAFNVNDASQPVMEALFNSRATHAFQSKSGEWNGPVPLVIAAHLYAPYQDTPQLPRGDVIVIDGYTETTFLETVSETQLVRLSVYEPDAGDHAEEQEVADVAVGH